MSADASHITEPDPTGKSPARASAALADAGIDPTEVGYVNAHATSTPLGDASETKVIKLALGEEHARCTPGSSTKGAAGHCFGAAGAIEAIFTTLALRDRVVPPTINLEDPDPDCDLDYGPNVAREVPDRHTAVTNSFGSVATMQPSSSSLRRLAIFRRDAQVANSTATDADDWNGGPGQSLRRVFRFRGGRADASLAGLPRAFRARAAAGRQAHLPRSDDRGDAAARRARGRGGRPPASLPGALLEVRTR